MNFPPPPVAVSGDVNAHDDATSLKEAVIHKLTSAWKSATTQSDFATFLQKRVDDLFDKISTAFKTPMDSEPNTINAISSGVEEFLLGSDAVQNKIDDCILWLLLYSAAKKAPEDEAFETSVIVAKMIITRDPYLAFDNLQESKLSGKFVGYKSFKDRCLIGSRGSEAQRSQQHHHFRVKVRGTPFHSAAEKGNFDIMKLIRNSLDKIEEGNRNAVYDVIKGRVADNKKSTALQYAKESGCGSVKTLRVLLDFDCLKNSGELDAIFVDSVKEGDEEVVNVFLDEAGLGKRFAKSEHILTAIREMPKDRSDQRHCYMRIVKRLIELTPAAEPLADEVIESIVEEQSRDNDELLPEQGEIPDSEPALKWMDIWETAQARLQGVLKNTASTSKLLHLAVYHQSLSLAAACLEHPEHSKSATVKESLPKSSKRAGAKLNQQYFPLWYNGKRWDDNASEFVDRPGSKEIRAILVSSTMRQTNKMQTLSEILYESGLRELCFDISRFNSKLYRVSDFVYSLMHHSENENLLSYEEIIRYAEFPALDLKEDDKETFIDNNYLSGQHTEVFEILDWLRCSKNVQRIVELKVPDRLINPHDEKGIAEVVEKFEVECLDWRCLDLSLSVFGSGKAGDKASVTRGSQLRDGTRVNCKIKELHLYSSGRRAAIDHWLGSKGIPSFTKLEKLHIHIVRETVTEKHCEDIVRFIVSGLNAMKKKYENEPTCNFKLGYGTVDSIFWNPTHTLVDLDEIAQRITPRLAKFLTSLGDLIGKQEEETGQNLRRTRVAIIDNGILSITPRPYTKTGEFRGEKMKESAKNNTFQLEIDIQKRESPDIKNSTPPLETNIQNPEPSKTEDSAKNHKPLPESVWNLEPRGQKSLWPRIKTGRSFVDNGSKVYPWLFASDPHGTQMANLICAMDPFCELYIARVAEGKYGITAERAARAIEWALEKQVDIISMSIAMLDEGKGDLQNAVNKAKEKGVIIVCSTYDEGTRTTKSYPAEYKTGGILVITACDEYGRLLREIDEKEKHQYNYKIHGQDVAAGVVPFVESSEYLTGSSVSTALAAGLSSLILTCDKLAHLGRNKAQSGGDKETLAGSNVNDKGVFPYAEGQLKKVEDHFKAMANDRHVVLERFGDIESTTKEGDEIYADRILERKFRMLN